MNSKSGHAIKNRKEAKDVFLTPIELAKNHINYIEYNPDEIWFDPFKNSGNYYHNFPNNNKVWTEILDGKDFFEFDGKVDIICSNPPYSIINPILEKCIQLNPRIISFLIGVNNLTTKRIENLNKSGYGLSKLKMLKVNDWFGMSFIAIFEKGKENCIDIDRTIYYTDK
jgi:hypothetical protein